MVEICARSTADGLETAPARFHCDTACDDVVDLTKLCAAESQKLRKKWRCSVVSRTAIHKRL